MIGSVVWVTGLPSSGKSTFAASLRAALDRGALPSLVLDGDSVRAALVPTPGYGDLDRDHFYETLARLAVLFAGQELVVIVPATANRRAFRERARSLAPRFVEVWIDVSLTECRARDTKGLYASAEQGATSHVPGSGASYEPPLAPEVVAYGGTDLMAIERVLALLEVDHEAKPIHASRTEPT